MDTLYAISTPFFVCLFYAILTGIEALKNRQSKYRKALFVFFIAATTLYFGHGVFFSHNTDLIPFTDWLYATCNLAVYPLWYLYICKLTQKETSLVHQLAILLPTILGCIAVGIVYIIMSESDIKLFIDHYLYHNQYENLSTLAKAQARIHSACKVMFAIQIIPALYLGYEKINKFNKYVKSTYSDIENKIVPASMHYLLVLFVITSLASFVVNIIGRYRFADSLLLISIPSIIFSVLLFSIGYVCITYNFSIEDIANDNKQIDDFIEENTQPSELRIRIEKLMEEEKIYLQPNLKLQDVVRYVQSNRNYVYNAINKEMGISFNDYINKLRIEYAKTLLIKQSNLSLNEIAEKSGFTSTASFYRNFKSFVGVSPKEFQHSESTK